MYVYVYMYKGDYQATFTTLGGTNLPRKAWP